MSDHNTQATITGVFAGQPQDRWPGKPPSAIHKTPLAERVAITASGFEQDQQADLTVHGDADKALHHYATDHYANWIERGLLPVGSEPAAFGENIATTGLVETQMCIGDTFRLGTALVQISQGRQPCWKLNAHTDQPQMAYQFQKSGWTGWYYRILEPGTVAAGDTITLVDRPQPDWTVAVVTAARLTRRIDRADAETLSGIPELAAGWRKAFAEMAAGRNNDDVNKRLGS